MEPHGIDNRPNLFSKPMCRRMWVARVIATVWARKKCQNRERRIDKGKRYQLLTCLSSFRQTLRGPHQTPPEFGGGSSYVLYSGILYPWVIGSCLAAKTYLNLETISIYTMFIFIFSTYILYYIFFFFLSLYVIQLI